MKYSRSLFLSAALALIALGSVLGLAVHDNVAASGATDAAESTASSMFFGRRAKNYGIHAPVGASIATTSTTDTYFQVPKSGRITHINFGSLAALAADDTNYITWTISNLGQAGAGTTAILSTADTNTTKATGGSALVASAKRSLVLSTTATNLDVVEGDTIRIRATASGTLAGAVTVPRYSVNIDANGQ